MPVLANARHERFAQEIAKGRPQVEAYRLAGYVPIESSACRLLSDAKVSARVAELKEKAAEKAVVTVADIAQQLDEDRAFAKSIKQASPMVSATMGKAKVLGLIVDKVDQKTALTVEDMSDHDLAKLIAFQLFTAAEETAH